ncbi:HK97 gp10 family phage protein [Clostridioides difficile]|uniref:HK97 gp10 family phage protein n=1 Tax=Clostridioides difficile TaxID=1496 RepID=UPI000C9BA2AC|nr:HK97 gp10 family phage protein [Clostridioides difficile]MCU5977963.1 HK97 gp10 family phage protein [Clostridioides difficile]MCU6153095.1 HK97 gp10 family phage protein [Clostridioides difficile]
MGITFDFSKLQQKLDSMERKAGKELVDNAIDAGGRVLVEGMKEEVRANVYDTGELYNSIGMGRKKGSGTKRSIEIGSQSNDRDVIARNFYNEYGTLRVVGKKHNKRSFNKNKKKANEAIKKSIISDLK